MANKFLLTLLVLLVSCGNPHTYSSKGPDKTNSPLETDSDCVVTEPVDGLVFFEFVDEKYTKCKTVISEDFNSFEDGPHLVLTNEDRQSFHYTLSHQNEKILGDGKVEYLQDIFDGTFYPLLVSAGIEHNGVKGKDKGVRTGSAKELSRDGLVWTFKNHITYFVMSTIGLAPGAKLRVFSCDQELLSEETVPATREKKVKAFGFMSSEATICHVTLSAGKDTASIALDDFQYGNLIY